MIVHHLFIPFVFDRPIGRAPLLRCLLSAFTLHAAVAAACMRSPYNLVQDGGG
jgi:hypothetical protein